MRSWIYNRAIAGLTAAWYRAVLERLPDGLRLLDVGIGTAEALSANAELVRQRDLRITGIDIDAAYLAAARRTVEAAGLADRVQLRHTGLDDFEGGRVDAVYFSGSFMLMPDPAAAARRAATLLDGEHRRVYFTQTFEDRRAPVLERVKPALRWLTTIDFGRVSYEAPFRQALADGGLEVVDDAVLDQRGHRSYRLVVARPAVQ